MVHGRARENEFGVSGYVYRNVFLTYDRETQSLWYPLDDTRWTAISGPRKGESIPVDSHPGVTTLGAWREAHPDTVVLLGSRAAGPK